MGCLESIAECVIFKCIDRATVDAFYSAAIEAGAKDNGKPGIRAHYHAHYYGAFVIVSASVGSSDVVFADPEDITGSYWQ